MKLCISTLGCPGLTLREAAEYFASIGICALELRGTKNPSSGTDVTDGGEMECLAPEHAGQTREMLSSLGIRPVVFGSSHTLHIPDPDGNRLAAFRREAERAAAVGFRYIRVFGNEMPDDATQDEYAARITENGARAADVAAACGITMLLETHGTVNTTEKVARILERLGGHPGFGILWDVVHTDRIYGDDVDDFYRVVRPYVRHIHLKDQHRADNALCLMGQGDIPLPCLCRRLLADGYEGYFSLEWEKKWHPELPDYTVAFPEYVAYMKQYVGEASK